MKGNLTAHEVEAIAQADAYLNNINLPTYTEMRDALNALSVQVLHAAHLDQHDPLRTHADEAATLVCKTL